jgi:hypothetical protein
VPPDKTLRTRDLPIPWGGDAYLEVKNGRYPLESQTYGPANFKDSNPSLKGTQRTESENHPDWRHASAANGDVGGEFSTLKQYVELSARSVGITAYKENPFFPEQGWGTTYTYGGPVLATDPINMSFPDINPSSTMDMNVLGTKAIADCAPTNTVASAGQALIELYREGLPHLIGATLWKQGINRLKSLGDEYLNVEFGFKPLANDIADFASAVVNFDRILKQYERDAGRVVRRRMNFPPIVQESSSTFADSAVGQSLMYSYFVDTDDPDNRGKVLLLEKHITKRWFSGAFTYYLPVDYDHRREVEKHSGLANKLLGLELTPSLLWELAPWSWVADWFSSAGAVINNFTAWANDGLVLRYGYMMEHIYASKQYLYVGPNGFRRPPEGGVGNVDIQPAAVKLIKESKQRKRATPFGFGFLFDDLSDRQKAILIALGIKF